MAALMEAKESGRKRKGVDTDTIDDAAAAAAKVKHNRTTLRVDHKVLSSFKDAVELMKREVAVIECRHQGTG